MGENAYKDANGQPAPGFRASARAGRDVDELIGICKGVIADGSVALIEAEYLMGWLQTHRELADVWPVSVLFDRVPAMLADGVLDSEEERELLGLIGGIAGGNASAVECASLSSDLPFTRPTPEVVFEGMTFCLTGTFVYGPRREVEALIVGRGGIVLPGVTMKLDYLMVGEVASRDWKHSTMGNKIIKAAEFAEKGRKVAIVGEAVLG